MLLRRILTGFVLGVVLLYVGDYVSVRYRIPGGRQQFDSVRIRPYLAIPQKDGKTEIILQDARSVTCVESLFPQLGSNPCWYVRRHTRQRIDM